MKLEMECTVCGKTHSADLRTLDEVFLCDACGNQGAAMEEPQIDVLEKQMLTSGKMGILAVAFTFLTLGALWAWLEAYDYDPTPKSLQETVFYIFAGCTFLLFVTGLVNSLFNRKVYF